MANFKLGELLVKANVLQESQLKAALVEQQRWGGKLGEILVRMSLVTEDILTRALSKQLGIPAMNLNQAEKPGPEVIKKIPLRVAEDLHVVPVQLKDEGRTLVVAMSDPLNVQFLDTLRAVSGCRIAPVLSGRSAVDRALSRYYRNADPEMEPEEDSFKVVDAQGRTVVKAAPTERDPAPAAPARSGSSSPSGSPSGQSPAEQLQAVEAVQRKEVAALKAIVELLLEKGIFSRDEYLAKVRK